MKRTIVWLCSGFLYFSLAAAPVFAGKCDVVIGTGSASINDELTIVQSKFDLEINGRPFTARTFGVVMGIKEIERDGTVHFLTTTDFTIIENGVKFSTIDEVRVDPANADNLSTSLVRRRILTGNRRYNCGETLERATVQDLVNVEFQSFAAKLCDCR